MNIGEELVFGAKRLGYGGGANRRGLKIVAKRLGRNDKGEMSRSLGQRPTRT